jgi:hypothetical protein
MSAFLVLDLLFVLLILLHMLIGSWQGPVKQLYVTLGITFGVLLADFWARPWGRDLADFTSLRADAGAFVVAIGFLWGSLLILGYGLTGTLAPDYLSPYTRGIGAAVAALNMMLALSFSLQYVRLFLLSDANEESLNDSYVARFLLDELGWVLLFAAMVAVPLVLYILISGRRAYESDDYLYEDEYDVTVPVAPQPMRRAATAQSHPPRVPGPPREEPRPPYKAEPVVRRRQPTEATRPLQVQEPRLTAEPAATHAADGDTPFGDTDPHLVIPAADAPPSAPVPASAEPTSGVASDMAPGYSRCRTCHAVLAPDTTICPNCGTLR